MNPEFWLYGAIVLFIGSLGFSSFMTKAHWNVLTRLARGTYAAGVVMATGALVMEMISCATWMITSFENGFLFVILFLGIVHWIMSRVLRIGFGMILISGMSLCLGILALLFRKGSTDIPTDVSVALGGHIFLVFLALVAFSLSFIFSVMFLIQNRLIKQKIFQPLLFRLPPLELTNRLNYLVLLIGTFAFTTGFVKGVIYMYQVRPEEIFITDPTYILSFLSLMIYCAILILRRKVLEGRRRIAIASVVAYILFLAVVCLAHSKMAGGAL